MQHVNNELEHVDTQDEEVHSVHTMLAQLTTNNTNATEVEIEATMKDTNANTENTNDDPTFKHEENEDISIDLIDQFYVTRSDQVEPHYKQENSTNNLQIKSILKVPKCMLSHTIDYMSYSEYDAFKKAI